MKGKYEAPVQKKNSKKGIALLLVLFLLVGCVIGTTLAWLMDSTDKITNTFTAGNIAIELTETADDFKMVPGEFIAKDPTVTVKAKSEACYVFVKIEESVALDDYISYSVDTSEGWAELAADTGIYWISQAALTGNGDVDATYTVLTGNQVQVLNTVEAADLEAVTNGTVDVELSFTAYAVQSEGFASAKAAWNATFGEGSPIA